MRAPTREERAKEASFLYSTGADTGITVLLGVVAITAGSLTILSEAVRSVLMQIVSYYTLWVLRAVHRDRLTRFEYGVAKVEQVVWVVVGLGLVVSGLWIAQTVVGAIVTAQPAASPLGLALSAVTNGINTAINVCGWYAMARASRRDDSEVYRAQLRARLTMMISSLFLQVTLTAAALAKDGAVALLLDAVGATFVVGLMLYTGAKMIGRALPSLLDAPASDELRAHIHRAATSVMAEEDIVAIRTRCAGPTTFADIAVAPTAFPTLAALGEGTAAIKDALRLVGAKVDLTVVPTPSGTTGRGQA